MYGCSRTDSRVTVNIYLPTSLQVHLQGLRVSHPTTARLIKGIRMKTLSKSSGPTTRPQPSSHPLPGVGKDGEGPGDTRETQQPTPRTPAEGHTVSSWGWELKAFTFLTVCIPRRTRARRVRWPVTQETSTRCREWRWTCQVWTGVASQRSLRGQKPLTVGRGQYTNRGRGAPRRLKRRPGGRAGAQPPSPARPPSL